MSAQRGDRSANWLDVADIFRRLNSEHTMLKIHPEANSLVLNLEFPHHWRQPRNPLSEAAAAWALTFVADSGLFTEDELAQRLDGLDLAEYAGSLFSHADRGTLCTVTARLALALLHGPRALLGAEEGEPSLMAALRGDGGQPVEPYSAAFYSLAQRYNKKLGRTFLNRHSERFRAWRHSLAEEAALQEAADKGHAPSLAAFLELRRVRVGLLPILDFLELDLGEELPPTIWQDPRILRIERLASEVVALQDDLCTFGRVGEGLHAIDLLRQEQGICATEAYRLWALRHNERVRELDALGRVWIYEQRSPQLKAWWLRLCGLIAGHGAWHCHLSSHSSPILLDGRVVRLTREDPQERGTELADDGASLLTATFRLPTLRTWVDVPMAG